MLGERSHHGMMVQVPPWSFMDDPTAGISPFSPTSQNANFNGDDYSFFLRTDDLAAIRRYLDDADPDSGDGSDPDLSSDAYSCDHFRMYEFKVRKCQRGRSHDWTDCPYAHPGEKARRRDPRKYNYSGTACPDFRKGNCKKGGACEFSHGVFECWLHPNRYRTQPCKDGVNCRRRVCFFAHTAEQLRVLSPRSESYDGSPLSSRGFLPFMSSPDTISPPSESPPVSPSVSDMVTSLRQLQLNKVKSMPTTWGLQLGPRLSATRPGFCSLPGTPTRVSARPGMALLDQWDKGCVLEEEPVMERVESGRDLRARMFEKLRKENPLDRVDPMQKPECSNPDVDWISDIVK